MRLSWEGSALVWLATRLLWAVWGCEGAGWGRERGGKRSSRMCEPSREHLHGWGQWATRRNASFHHLSLILPSEAASGEFRRVLEEELESQPILSGGTECPSAPVLMHDEPVMLRSVCPWYWKLSYEPRRIPSVLPKAVCRCQKAVMGSEPSSLQCHPLTIQIKVLMLDDDCQDFRESTTEIPVACVPVLQPVHHLEKLSGIESVEERVYED